MNEHHSEKPMVYIPFDILPDSKNWVVGKAYRTRIILRQVSTDEKGANFEVVDAFSLEANSSGKPRFYMTEDGTMKS